MSADINSPQIDERNNAAMRIVMGFAADMPILAEVWRTLIGALDDTRLLSAKITDLADELRTVRLDRANLLAAIRAATAAQRDGEADPLYYLRDELDAQTGARRS